MANKKYNNASMNSDEVGRLIKMVVIVTVVFLLFYAVTLIVTKEARSLENSSNNSIQRNFIR